MKRTKTIYILTILLFLINKANGQNPTYGMNDIAGSYLDVGDAKIYYEVYGKGKPILLLHGGMFGYIDEYEKYIPVLSKNYKVIAIATRGHGKSELGTRKISYELFAEDASKILKNESKEAATIIGFSDGAITSYLFAAQYPSLSNKVISLAGGFGSNWFHKEALESMKDLTGESLEKHYPGFVKERKKLMPKPEQWNQFITELNEVNMQPVFISDKLAKSIICPVLIIGGDRDDYFRIDNFIHIYKTLPDSQLAIIPKCGHIDLVNNEIVLKNLILPFLSTEKN